MRSTHFSKSKTTICAQEGNVDVLEKKLQVYPIGENINTPHRVRWILIPGCTLRRWNQRESERLYQTSAESPEVAVTPRSFRLRRDFSSAECFPDVLPIEIYTKEMKVAKLWRFLLQNQGAAAANSSDLRSFLLKTVQFANDRGKRVSGHRRRAGAKIGLPEWVCAGSCCLPHRTRQAQVSSPNFDRSLCWFVVLLALLSHFLVARATKNCRYSCPVQRYLKQSLHCSVA